MSLTPTKTCITGVIDQAVKIANLAGVNDTGDACIAGVIDTGDAPVGPLAVRQCL